MQETREGLRSHEARESVLRRMIERPVFQAYEIVRIESAKRQSVLEFSLASDEKYTKTKTTPNSEQVYEI